MTKKTGPCRIWKLAQSECCLVEYCPHCGMFHVGIGAFTIRLRLAALHTINATLTSALQSFKNNEAFVQAANTNWPEASPRRH